jgi:hypothetical protein
VNNQQQLQQQALLLALLLRLLQVLLQRRAPLLCRAVALRPLQKALTQQGMQTQQQPCLQMVQQMQPTPAMSMQMALWHPLMLSTRQMLPATHQAMVRLGHREALFLCWLLQCQPLYSCMLLHGSICVNASHTYL